MLPHSDTPATALRRKRTHADTVATERASPSAFGHGWRDLGASAESFGGASPAPLANSRYRLAGGLDTPTREAAAQFDSMDAFSETDFRRRWTTMSRNEETGAQIITMGALDRDRNARRRGTAIEPPTPQSWGQFVFSTVSGIAGKVWDFCTAGNFQGFRSGGGDGYIFTSSGPQRIPSNATQRTRYNSSAGALTPIPGQYPTEGPDEGFFEVGEDRRPAKRRQLAPDDWVMVSRDTTSAHSSPAHRTHASRPSLRPGVHRRPKASVVRLSSASAGPSLHSSPHHQRSASIATPRSPASNSPSTARSAAVALVNEDLERYSAKRKREMKESDASMRRLNNQLKMMIQQSKDALNSKVEVDDEHELDEDGDEYTVYDEGRSAGSRWS